MKPREMTGPGPSPAELETILTIGARVPDHGKLAPWRFIVFEGDARVRAGELIAKVFASKNPQATPAEIEVEKRRLTDAPLVIGIVSFTKPHPKVPPWEQELSAGGSARLWGLLADRLVRLRSRRARGTRIEARGKTRRLHPYRNAIEAERRPAAAGALGHRHAILRLMPLRKITEAASF